MTTPSLTPEEYRKGGDAIAKAWFEYQKQCEGSGRKPVSCVDFAAGWNAARWIPPIESVPVVQITDNDASGPSSGNW